MAFDLLFEPQPRSMARALGWLALAAGLFALGFALWLPFQDPGRSPVGFTRGLAGFTGLLGLYTVNLARRLLGPARPRYLVSPFMLAVVGIVMAAGAVVQFFWVPQLRWSALDGLFLASACWVLAWRRYRLQLQGDLQPEVAT